MSYVISVSTFVFFSWGGQGEFLLQLTAQFFYITETNTEKEEGTVRLFLIYTSLISQSGKSMTSLYDRRALLNTLILIVDLLKTCLYKNRFFKRTLRLRFANILRTCTLAPRLKFNSECLYLQC